MTPCAGIAQAIQEGALAFLRREYTWLAVFVAIIAVVLAVIPDIGWETSISYVLGRWPRRWRASWG